jgi:hypothetical protein
VRSTFYFANQKINYGGCQRDKVIRLFQRNTSSMQGLFMRKLLGMENWAFLKIK